MLHKNRLIPDQPSGQLLRIWRERHTGPLSAVMEAETQLLPAIQPTRQRFVIPKFVDSRISADPLIMLFGCCLLAIDKYQQAPDELFVSSYMVPAIRQRSLAVTGVPYNGKFRFYSDGDLQYILIRTEAFLPPLLKLALADQISIDQVIGLIW
jgi:hypothetical protein